MAVNTLGFSIATLFIVRLAKGPSSIIETGLGARIETLFFSGFVVGAIVGPMQAYILKRKVSGFRIWQWILASILSSYAGAFLATIGLWLFDSIWTIPLIASWVVPSIFGAIVGICVGFGQVFVLDRHVRGLGRWWTANTIGRSLGWVSAYFAWALLQGIQPIVLLDDSISVIVVPLVYGAVGGLVYGGVTAMALPNLTQRQ
ncbi:MAG: hypothetical protein AAFN08_01880 [Cyanobacteria bacterium J06559_3]